MGDRIRGPLFLIATCLAGFAVACSGSQNSSPLPGGGPAAKNGANNRLSSSTKRPHAVCQGTNLTYSQVTVNGVAQAGAQPVLSNIVDQSAVPTVTQDAFTMTLTGGPTQGYGSPDTGNTLVSAVDFNGKTVWTHTYDVAGYVGTSSPFTFDVPYPNCSLSRVNFEATYTTTQNNSMATVKQNAYLVYPSQPTPPPSTPTPSPTPTPTPTPRPTPTPTPTPTATPIPSPYPYLVGRLFVANNSSSGNWGVEEFSTLQSGNATPVCKDNFASADSVALDSNFLTYVAFPKSNQIWQQPENQCNAGSQPVIQFGYTNYGTGTYSIYVDSNDYIWVSTKGNQVLEFYPWQMAYRGPNIIQTVPMRTISVPPLSTPVGMAVDSDGNLYVANYGGASVTVVGPAGHYHSIAGSSTGFVKPYSVALDGKGHLWVTDPGAGKIYVFNKSDSGNVAPAVTITSSVFKTPHGLTFDNDGNTYFYTTEDEKNAIYGFLVPSNVSGTIDLEPFMSISGSNTGLDHPLAITAPNANSPGLNTRHFHPRIR